MSNSQYLSVDVDGCLARRHKLKTVWSDKNPMKVSLTCLTCTEATGKTAFVAYGIDTAGFGQWHSRRKEIES
jgi:hypothetical protein